jgi:hypothetical protein
MKKINENLFKELENYRIEQFDVDGEEKSPEIISAIDLLLEKIEREK